MPAVEPFLPNWMRSPLRSLTELIFSPFTIVPIETPSLGDRSYLVHDGAVAFVVDPQRDIDRLLDLLDEHDVRLSHVFETHIHNDYVTGGLALARRPMTVGELVEAVDVGQSTVSHHLKLLAEVGFVLVERRGTSSLYRVNEHCLAYFPSAAEVVMGQLPRYEPVATSCMAPWQQKGPPRSRARRKAPAHA